MLLSPYSFEFRLVIRLEVRCPELQPTELAIQLMRDTAHTFASCRSSLSNARLLNAALLPLPLGYEPVYDIPGAAELGFLWRLCRRDFAR